MDDLLPLIEAFCAAHRMSESRFGREALNDTRLVRDLRKGRELRRAARERVAEYMTTYVRAAA